MADAAVTARYAALELVTKLLNEIKLVTSPTGAYNVENATKWMASAKNRLKELYVPGGSANHDGALQLCNNGSDLVRIKSTDMHTATSVLKYHRDLAASKTSADPNKTVHQPEITSRTDANDEAKRLNTPVQYITGVKEAIAKVSTAKFGKHITDSVLRTADCSDLKSINDWIVDDLLEAIRQGADRPTSDSTQSNMLKIINTAFNFQSKVQTNFDTLNAQAGQLKHFGIILGPSITGFILFRQVEHASKYDWGRDFQPHIQTIRQKYPYNHIHDATSIADMLQLFAGADSVRNLSAAPATLPGSALAVDLVSQLLQERDVYDTDDEATEQASAVSAESSNTRCSSRGKKDDDRRGRSRSRFRDRSRGRDCSRSTSLECKHCDKNNVCCRHYGISHKRRAKTVVVESKKKLTN